MKDPALRTIARLQCATGVGILLFWIAFFTVGLAPENPPPGYYAFEHSFPLPDGVLAAGLLTTGALLLSANPARRQAGRALSLVCAGALLFLGLVDTSFNIQNGMYLISPLDTALALFINAWCVGFGLAIAIRCRA